MQPAVCDVVGREAILADLTGWLTPAAEGRGRAVVLSGEAGIGTSTVVGELAVALSGAFRVLRGWCSAAAMTPYWPWRRALGVVAPGLRFSDHAGPDERELFFGAVIDALEEAWSGLWVYLAAPPIGALAAAALYRRRRRTVACGKLIHDDAYACHFLDCRYTPAEHRLHPRRHVVE